MQVVVDLNVSDLLVLDLDLHFLRRRVDQRVEDQELFA